MTSPRVRLAAFIGVCFLSVSVGCGTRQSNPLSSGTNGLSDAALAEAITTVTANSIASEVLALSEETPLAPSPAGERPRLDRLKEALGLTDDQVAQIQQIIEATRQAIQSIRQQVRASTLTRQQAHEQIRALHEQQKAQVEAVLTPEQRQLFAELRTEHDRQFNLRRLQQALSLTDDQVAQIEQIMKTTWTQVQEIKRQVEAGTLTPEQARAQIQALHQSEKAQLEGVLTADQLARFRGIMAHHRHGPQRRRG